MQSAVITKDIQLIERIIAGDRNALEEVYKKHYRVIEKYILLNSGNTDDARDAFQETMLILYRKVNEAEFQLTSKLDTLLYGICRNVWLKNLDKKRIQEKHLRGYEQELDCTVSEEDINKHGRISRIRVALEALGEPCRTILRDFFFGGLNMEEIAEKMGYTNSDNAKNQKYKCMQRLKKSVITE